MVSLLISLIFGNRIISILRQKQIGESIRDLGLEGQSEKAGTPTMGGIIILAAILVPLMCFGDLGNISHPVTYCKYNLDGAYWFPR